MTFRGWVHQFGQLSQICRFFLTALLVMETIKKNRTSVKGSVRIIGVYLRKVT